MARSALMLGIFLALTAPIGVHAQPVGSEFQVNTYTTSFQGYPAMATAANGDFVVVWPSVGQDGDASGVFGQRYTSAGAAVGAEFHVNTSTTLYQALPAVAAAADGDFVVVWSSSFEPPGFFDNIVGQRFTSAGAAVGAEFQVNTYTTCYYPHPAVAAGADGAFVVVWDSLGQDGSSSGIFGQRYTSGGAAVGTEFQVNTYRSNAQYGPAVAAAPDGAFAVVWNSYQQDGALHGVFGQRFQPITGETATIPVGAGGSVTTDDELDGATSADPVETTVTTPNAGTIAISETPVSGVPTGGFRFIGQKVTITAPNAAPGAPLVLVFEIDASIIPPGNDESTITVFRDGTPVPECTGSPGVADPDPCVSSRVLQGDGDVEITVLTSSASDWTFATTLTTILGKRLLVKDPRPVAHPSGVDPDKRQVVVLGKEVASPDAVLGDPIATGATLTLIANGTTPTQQAVVIPPGAKTSSTTAGWLAVSGGYQYSNPTSTGAGPTPVKSVLIKKTPAGTFLLKVVLKGQLQGSVDVLPPAPGTDGGLIFTIPDGGTYCVHFGGAAGGKLVNAPATGALQYQQTFKIVSTATEPTNEGAGCPAP